MLGIVSKGIIIGVLVSAPMGPIGMLCIQRTLNKGRWHGFVTGLGAALSDVIYAALTCLGMGVVVNFVEANQAPLQLIGSIVLGIFGYYIFQSNPVRNLKKQREKKLSFTQGKLLIKLIDRECNQSSYNLLKAYLGSFRAGFWNFFAGMFGASLKSEYDPKGKDAMTERVVVLVENGLI